MLLSDPVKSLQEHADRKGVRCTVHVEDEHYIIRVGNREEYKTQKFEHAAAHIDMMWIALKFS